MQSLDRVDFSNNWTTLVFLLCLLLLVVLKTINPQKLFEYSRAFILKGFIADKAQERAAFFSVFNLSFYLFSILIYALLLTYLTPILSSDTHIDFKLYLKITFLVFVYFSAFKIVDFLLCNLFEIRPHLSVLMAAKSGYTYNISLLLFPLLAFAVYSFLHVYVLLIALILFFTLSFVLMIVNNKNLIVSKLFYFILYLCALEIAPLLIIYKITV